MGTSFKLISHLRIRCKSIFGLNQQSLHRLISRTSSIYLKHLDLSDIASIVNDNTIKQMTAYCNQLTFVSLARCHLITDCALIPFLKKNRWLKSLNICGCHRISSKIGDALSLCLNLNCLNFAWCTEMDANIIPFLLYLAQNGCLREINLHCIHKFVSLYSAFNHCFKRMDERIISGKLFELKNKLIVIGGLQKKTLNEEDFDKNIECLKRRGIEYMDPNSFNLRSIAEHHFEHKINLLLNSKLCQNGYRLYDIPQQTNKVYMILSTENGVFGIKLNPNKDFEAKNQFETKAFIEKMKQTKQNPIKWLKEECDFENWDWSENWQSKRCLVMLGSESNANWIVKTARIHCPQINVLID